MKKIILPILAALAALASPAQTKGDKITIHFKDNKTEAWDLTDEGRAPLSALRHTADGRLNVYMKGVDDTPLGEYDVDDISSIDFSVYHEGDLADVTLADTAATSKAKRLYLYLRQNYGSKIISGVMANVNWNHDEADKVYAATGKYPAMNGYDFIHIYVPENNWINYDDITPVTEWADAGGLVTLMWHFNVPVAEDVTPGTDGSGVTCAPEATTFRASRALQEGTWENKWLYQQMDRVAQVLLKLQDAGVAAVWRPFHEAAGNAELKSGASWGKSWFWWGYEGAEVYKQLWRAMFGYLQHKGVHNLVWAWTTQNYNGDSAAYNSDEAWYPGDEYVDIIGRDLYGYSAASQAQEFEEIQARHPGKMVTLAECGTNTDTQAATAGIDEAWGAGAKWSYFMPWYSDNMPTGEWWKAAMGSSHVITRGQTAWK